MRQLLILILSTCSIYANCQTDTLSADKINFEFLGQKGNDLENIGQMVKLIVHYQTDNATFYKLKLNHQHGNNYRSSTTYDLNKTNSKTGHDTVYFHVRQLVPGDKFVLEYFENIKFKEEFNILSTAKSNNKPYYTDIAFVYNGDTLSTSKFSVLGQKSVLLNDKLIRIPTDKVTQFTIEFKSKHLTYELGSEIIYHKFVIAGYVDNIKAIEKAKEYSSPLMFMQEYSLQKIRLIKIIDTDDKREVKSEYSQAW